MAIRDLLKDTLAKNQYIQLDSGKRIMIKKEEEDDDKMDVDIPIDLNLKKEENKLLDENLLIRSSNKILSPSEEKIRKRNENLNLNLKWVNSTLNEKKD